MFAVYLVETRSLRPSTADQYIAHVSKMLFESNVIPSGTAIRSETLKAVLKGLSYSTTELARPPKSRSCYIPFTYDMLILLNEHILSKISDRRRRTAILAAIAVGYGCSLRSSEYLPKLSVKNPFDPKRHISVDSTLIYFSDGSCLPLDQLNSASAKARATFVTFGITVRKNHRKGTAGNPRLPALSLLPGSCGHRKSSQDDDRRICLVQCLIDYAVLCKPVRGLPLFTANSAAPISWSEVREIFRKFAVLMKIPPERFVPYSSRYGVLTNMIANGASEQLQLAQGDWTSKGGPLPYFRQSFQLARNVAPYVYDRQAGNLEEICAVYCDPTDMSAISTSIRQLNLRNT